MTPEEGKAELAKLRHEIDDIDDRIVDVLAERFAVTRKVGVVKRDAQLGPTDPAREQELYERVKAKARESGINADVVESLYRTLMGHVVVEHKAIAEGEEPKI